MKIWDTIINFIKDFGFDFHLNFIKDDRWKFLADGFAVTMYVTLGALVLGLLIGVIIAIIRSTHDKTGKLKLLNGLCKAYLTIIRGTPTLVQLLIIYFVIFGSVDVSKLLVAIIAFGVNSGAYTAEIIRAGIMSIPKGQFEAGSSLGFSYMKTMRYIVMPQAFKTILPALINECITLLKETSIAGFIALQDLTKGGDIIRSQTYDPFLPLLAVAAIYLGCVSLITFGVNKIEQRLKRNE